jgi:hypothetical protein
MTTAKSYEIPKRLVWEAYKRVKANGGAAGVDEQSLLEFEGALGNNLYRIWNRMSSSYFHLRSGGYDSKSPAAKNPGDTVSTVAQTW